MQVRSQPALSAVVIILCSLGVFAGLLLPMSGLLAGTQDGDGALTALISTQKLTWYFWGQDRLLNLLPALALPFRDPEMNLHVQVFMRAALAFLSPIGALCLFRGSWRSAPIVVAVSQCLIALALSPYASFNMWVQHNPCGTSLVLFAISAFLCQAPTRWRQGLGLVALFLAYAVNLALIIWSLPFLAVGFAFGIRDRRWLMAFAAGNLLALILAWAHAHWFGEAATKFALHPSLDAVLSGYRSLAAEVDLRIAVALFVAAVVAAIVRRSRESTMAILVALGMVAAVGAISCLDWLQTNVFNIRYFLTFITVFVSCCVYVIFRALPQSLLRLSFQSAAAACCGAVMFLVPMRGMSATPFELMDARWREASEVAAQMALDSHASLIVGDFWDVWPVVMDARSDSMKRVGSNDVIYGAAFRGHVLRRKINRLFDKQPSGVLALCMQPVVDDCGRVATANAQLTPAVVADRSSARAVTIGGKRAYVVLLHRSI